MTTIKTIVLAVGVAFTSYASGTPGDQVWQAILGGVFLGSFVALMDWDKA